MKLFWGDTETLTGQDWAQVELNINSTSHSLQIEVVAVKAALWGRKFPAFELYVPIERVGMAGIELMVPSLYARVERLGELREMDSVGGGGVEGIAQDGSGNVLRVPDEFVEQLMARERRSNPVRPGAFVRILWGPERMLCGTVRRLTGRTVTVSVETRSRKVNVTLPLTAVESLVTRERDYYSKES